ncbi:MAG: DUF692 domain-containing protein [Acidobacteriota bacterium]
MDVHSLPRLGVGIGYRPEMRELYSQHADRIDWLELIADRYLEPESLERALPLKERFPLVPHGLEMSVGSDQPLDTEYCEQIAEFIQAIDAPFHSDHLCMTKIGGHDTGIEMGTLVPLPFTETVASRCAAKARQIRDLLGVPFALENITYPFQLPGSMPEAEFLQAVMDEGECGMLLDLTNVFINSQNHGYDPYRFLESLPLDRVVQVHLAGSIKQGDEWIDSHSHGVDSHPEVWGLLEYTVAHSPVRGVLFERDQSFPDDFVEILADLDRAREIFDGAPN